MNEPANQMSELSDPSSVEMTVVQLFEDGKMDLAHQTLTKYLDTHSGDLDPTVCSELSRLLFEIAWQLPNFEARRDAAKQWLEAMADEGENGWRPVLEPATRASLDATFVEPNDRLEWLELLSFAPETIGLSDEAVALIEDFGYQHAAAPELARASERLLHALGQRDAAYRVERYRRAAKPHSISGGRKDDEKELRLTGLTIAIAGGHPALRRAIHNDLMRAGAKEVREIPPRWEGSRQSRDVAALVSGSDVAVLIGRHISHSTIDQVKRGAALAGVPVLTVITASASSVRKALEDYFASS